MTLIQEGRLDEALQVVEKAWDKAEPAAIARATGPLLAESAISQAQVQRVEGVLVAASKEHDRPVALLLALGNLRISQERYEEAEAIFREVLAKNEGNVVALNNLAVLLALRGTELDEARQFIETAIDVAGPIPTLLDSRATVYLALRDPVNALADLEAAIADAPSATWYFHKAQVHYEVGQLKAATDALAKAHELGLTPEQLSPLERQAYHDLQEALKARQASAE